MTFWFYSILKELLRGIAAIEYPALVDTDEADDVPSGGGLEH